VRGGGPSSPVLARLVGDTDAFASTTWGRAPLLTQTGPHEFDDVLTLADVDRLVSCGARLPTVRMVSDGAPLAPARYCSTTRLGGRTLDDVVDPVKIVSRLGEGATLVLQSLHRTVPSVGDVVAALQDEISHPVQANAYLTPPGAAGLAEHADLHDVFAVQLHGSKRWWVDGLGDVTVHPGDVLYVPRGTRHRAATDEATSLHLTIGIIRVTHRQVLERLLQTSGGSLDTPLPLGFRHPERRDALERSLDTALDAALDAIGSVDLEVVAEREQTRRLGRPSQRGRLTSLVCADEIDLDTSIRWVAPEPLARAVDAVDGRTGHWDGLREHDDQWSPAPERVLVDVGDRTLGLPTSTLPSLRMLSGGELVRVGDLAGLDEPSRLVLAKRLVREAVCVIEARRNDVDDARFV
jgi:mannose-6-phosphate isomerase-like protein (cupin superfamily)